MKPKISVIVPIYNVEEYLEKCLDSLVNQTLKDIEIILINDGSPDNSEEIVNKYLKKYKEKIIYHKKENEGQGIARNYGINLAKGEFISFVDSDDYVDKTMFEKLYNKAHDSVLVKDAYGNDKYVSWGEAYRYLNSDIIFPVGTKISMLDLKNNEQYYYKFNYSTDDGKWRLTDYYKIN